MAAEFQGKIELDIRDSEPDWGPYAAPTAPEGAPNVLYIVWDDTGIATWDCFGGLVDMPAMSRIAERGVRLSQFHTTALCSPTRASLLTGPQRHHRRHGDHRGVHRAGSPNCNGRIPADTALLSEVLAEQGWNTYCVGKWHLTPLEESNLASTKRHWPTVAGLRTLLRIHGRRDRPVVSRPGVRQPPGQRRPATPEEGYHLSKDIADKTIEFIRDAKVIAPDKPWFSYVCPGAGHAPHHVFKEWADKYAGKFDMGYETLPRDRARERRRRWGSSRPDTELSPINPYLDVKGPNGEPWPLQDTVRPWDSLNDEEKKLFCRMAEVFAGFLSYTDAQIGRILDYLEESGQLDNTIIVVISDNGASGEGGPERIGERGQVLQRLHRHRRGEHEGSSTTSAAPRPTTTTRSGGRWPSTRPTSCTSATPRMRAASPTPQSSRGPTVLRRTARCATTTSTSATSPRPSTTCWASPRRRRSRASRRSRWTV